MRQFEPQSFEVQEEGKSNPTVHGVFCLQVSAWHKKAFGALTGDSLLILINSYFSHPVTPGTVSLFFHTNFKIGLKFQANWPTGEHIKKIR